MSKQKILYTSRILMFEILYEKYFSTQSRNKSSILNFIWCEIINETNKKYIPIFSFLWLLFM